MNLNVWKAVPAWMPLLAGLILASPYPAASDPVALPDSTVSDRWVLGNGLRVVTRHIPRARAVAIVVCYRTGSSLDPPGREGLASVLAEVAFTGAAGEVPERTREEMTSLRPMGWNLKVTPTFTQLSEIASHEQFPGVLHQVALRARGVTVTQNILRSAVATVKRNLTDDYSDLNRALYYQVRGLAAGATHATLLRGASGKGIQDLTAKEIQQQLQKLYAPANAILGVAGNLTGYDARRLIEREFGGLPGGTPRPDPRPTVFAPGSYTLSHPGLTSATGALGVIGPAIDDSLHPSFCLHALLFGSFCRRQWGPPSPPLSSRFAFSVLDDPGLVRFYPPVSPDPHDSTQVAEEFLYTLNEFPLGAIEKESYDEAFENLEWLLGGSLSTGLLKRMRNDPGALYTLCSGMAARETWGEETFWAQYRRRFEEAAEDDLNRWRSYFITRDHLIQLRLVPEKETASAH